MQDISDDIAKEGEEFLDAYSGYSDGKRRAKFKTIDEQTGDVTTTTVKYKKDGSVKKVVVKGDSQGKLKVKAARDGHIAIKGDLQSNHIMKEASVEVSDTKVIQEHCEEKEVEKKEDNIPELREIVVRPKSQPVKRKVVPKTSVPKAAPVVEVPDVEGKYISDVPAQSKSYRDGGAVDRNHIREMYAKHGINYLLDAYCNNSPTAKYTPSSERGNLNQLNAKFMTGCFIHAEYDGTVLGAGGRKLPNMKADYKQLNDLINAARARDVRVGQNDKILGYIALEIRQHQQGIGGRNLPDTNNHSLDLSKLPSWFVQQYKLQ